MVDNQTNKRAARAFAAAFANSAGEALGRALGTAWPLEVVPPGAESPTHPGQPLHLRLKIEGRLSGECFVEFYEPQASTIAAKLLRRPPVNDETSQVLEKVLATATKGLQAALAGEFGELNIRFERVAGLAFGGMFVVPLVAPADPSGPPVLLYFDGQMLAALGGAAPTSNTTTAQTTVDSDNLKLVMDVELNVSLRFGQRQLPLREVLELTSGSVIELDRMVDEPVELLLDGKLIARGEAVIVDGNYGLRITEIPQPVASHFLR
jgi:flagellar motor switch protein FliN/FliY